MKHLTGRLRGIVALLTATLFWGTSVVLGRLILRETTPLVLSMVSAALCTLTLLLPLALFRRDLLSVDPHDLWRFGVIGTFGFALGSVFINTAIQRTNAATAATLQYLCPAITYAWGLVHRTERFEWRKALAVVLAISGCALATGILLGRFVFDPWGVLAGVGSATCFAFITVFGKTFASRYNPLAYTGYVFLAMMLAYLPITPTTDIALVVRTPPLFWLLTLNAVVFSVVPTVLYFESLKWISPTAVAIVLSFEIVVTSALGWLWLGERLGPAQILGGAMVIAAVALIEQAPDNTGS